MNFTELSLNELNIITGGKKYRGGNYRCMIKSGSAALGGAIGGIPAGAVGIVGGGTAGLVAGAVSCLVNP
ncbi:Blp family class II bacteriocin [uncultured Rummeliibacillus sp.]|uniref:Blp family class II bacteriocin n=1 Tax=uncultured Rummeliibacillus sp. TaxID=762292 RepID=UPI00262E4CE1|nr:Blp family class II bacteriocin [uncultured Rummeliibacillus sp.]